MKWPGYILQKILEYENFFISNFVPFYFSTNKENMTDFEVVCLGHFIKHKPFISEEWSDRGK